MARCSCSGQTCGCRIEQGAGISVTGAGSPRDPWIITAEGGEGGGGGWLPGDLKDSVRPGIPAGWLAADGQAVSRTGYAALFDVLGTTYGSGDGFSTFNVPSYVGMFRLGAGAGFPLHGSGGTAQTLLTIGNIPGHTHTMAHVHTMAHSHRIDHDHPVTATSADAHRHTMLVRRETDKDESGSKTRITNVGGAGGAGTTDEGQTSSDTHQHNVNIPAYVGNSGGSSAGNTGGSSAPNTGSTGGSAPFSNMPPFRGVRVLIKT